MKAKAFFLFFSYFLFSFADTSYVAANQKPCTTAEEKQALDEADGLQDWDAPHRSFVHFGPLRRRGDCGGYSDSVGRLLGSDWKHIGTLARLVAYDKKLESFVLRDIDETLPADTLKKIANMRRKLAPPTRLLFAGKYCKAHKRLAYIEVLHPSEYEHGRVRR
jgi:hypothetical protein